MCDSTGCVKDDLGFIKCKKELAYDKCPGKADNKAD